MIDDERSMSAVAASGTLLDMVVPHSIDARAGSHVPSRISSLDIARGVAILGSLGTNVWLITDLGGAASWSPASLDAASAVERVLFGIANGKFLALLTLLFGVGLELQYRSAVRRGLRWPGRYLRRAGVLGLEGLIHYLLVFEYDVLMGYAIASVIVAYLVGRSDRVQLRWVVGLGGAFVLTIVGATAALLVLPSTEVTPTASTASLADQIGERIVAFPLYRIELLAVVPQAVVLFLVAVRLLRADVFGSGDVARRLRARLTGWGLGVGIALNAATTWAGSDWFLVERYIAAPLVAVGGLALITHLVLASSAPGPVARRLADVGRTALTCYVMQNLVACVLAYDWGLGLNGRLVGLGPWWPVLLWVLVATVNVLFAWLWLRRHDRGPIELMAHRLA